MNRRKALTLASLLLLGIAAGCFSQRSPRFYLLEDTKPQESASVAPIPGNVFIDEFTIASEYSQQSLAFRTSSYRIQYDPLRQWAIPPEDMVRERVFRFLDTRGVFEQVSLQRGFRSPTYVMKGNVLRVGERVQAGRRLAELSLKLELADAKTDRVLWRCEQSREKVIGMKRFEEVVAGLSGALQEILQACTQELRAQLKSEQ